MKLTKVVVCIALIFSSLTLCQPYYRLKPFLEGFCEGTLVKTSDGYLPIDTIRVNDTIVGYDSEQTYSERAVVSVSTQQIPYFLKITTDTNTIIYAAPKQKFYQPITHDWTEAEQLLPGTVLLRKNVQLCVVESVERIDEPTEVYCITVDGHHFCVTTDDVVAHNFAPAVFVIGPAAAVASPFITVVAPIVIAAGVIAGILTGTLDKWFGRKKQKNVSGPCQGAPAYQPQYQSYENQDLIYEYAYPQKTEPRAQQTATVQPGNGTNFPTMAPDEPVGPTQLEAKSNKQPKHLMKSSIPQAQSSPPNGGNNNNDDDEKKKNNNKDKGPNGTYEDAGYHHPQSPGGNGPGAKSPAPRNGQRALDTSIEVENSSHRVSIEGDMFVALYRTGARLFHGFVTSWGALRGDMQDALIKAGRVTAKGKILWR